jgi:hypothetical protein
VNPEVIQFTMTSWGTTIAGASGDAAGACLKVTNQSDGQGTRFYGGYGPVDSNQSDPSWTGWYNASVPVEIASQYAYYNLSLNANESGTIHLVQSISSQAIDLLGTSTQSLNQSWSTGPLVGWYRVLRVPEAANTLLWTPANNTTLSNVPWGLKRYTAEPDFDLLVLNVSGAASVGGLPWATTKGTYSLSLSQGLNNILVPRTSFLTSPLAQALLNNSNMTLRVSSGAAENFNGTNWSSRSQTSGSNPVPSSTSPNPNFIWVISSLSQFDGTGNGTGSIDFGGLPQSPLEASFQSRQVQSVIWINVSGYGSLKTDSEELASLFAGLTLNATGGVAGNLLEITSQLPTLGLPQPVLTALANTSIANSGAYSPPQWNKNWHPPPSSGWSTIGSVVFNAVSGVISLVTTGASVVWNGLVAAEAYVATAAVWLYQHTGLNDLANQLAKGLRALVSAMEWALDQLLNYVLAAVKALISPIVSAADAGLTGYIDTLVTAVHPLWAEFNNSQALSESGSDQFIDELFGTPFLIALALSTIIAIAFVILEVLSFGAGTVVTIVEGLLVSSAVTGLVAGVSNLIPSDLLSTEMVSGAWDFFNLTGGGAHRSEPRVPNAGGVGNISSSTFGLLLGIVGVALTGFQLYGDVGAGPAAVLLTKYAFDGYLSYVVAAPIVNLALDLLSFILGIASLLVSGAVQYLLNVIGLFVGLAGDFFGLALLVVPKLSSDVKEYGMANSVLTGLALGGIATSLNVAQLYTE